MSGLDQGGKPVLPAPFYERRHVNYPSPGTFATMAGFFPRWHGGPSWNLGGSGLDHRAKRRRHRIRPGHRDAA